MRRAALLVAAALFGAIVPATTSGAGIVTTDVYRSHFVAVDRDGFSYSIDAVVEDRPSGAQLVVEVRRRCGSCRAAVYAKTLGPGDLRVTQLPLSPECQCMSASVRAKFGGKELAIDWVWDPEQGGGPSGDGFEWTTVTANNLMNVSCFGTGTATSTPDAFSGEEPQPPKGAKRFPKKMPAQFRVDVVGAPGCHVETP